MGFVSCFSCGYKTQFQSSVSVRGECEGGCSADIHVCKNCCFYDPHCYNECKESSADRVREKDRANYCDYFKPKALGNSPTQGVTKEDLRAQAESIFRKKI